MDMVLDRSFGGEVALHGIFVRDCRPDCILGLFLLKFTGDDSSALHVQSVGDNIKDATNDASKAVKGAARIMEDATGSATKNSQKTGRNAGNAVDDATSNAQNEVRDNAINIPDRWA